MALPTGSSDGQLAVPINDQPGIAREVSYRVPYPGPVKHIRLHIFKIFIGVTYTGSLVALIILYFHYTDHNRKFLGIPCNSTWLSILKYLSIPLVSIVFTWWHVYLGIQMCFYPVDFVGCCPPVLGWQGIVPRRAEIMASRACDIMIGDPANGGLISLSEIINKVDPEEFFVDLHDVLTKTTQSVLEKVCSKNWPVLWSKLPGTTKEELKNKILDESKPMFAPIILHIRENIENIIDVKQMCIDILIANKRLLVDMFQEIGARELVFVQHVSAVMGFFCGIIQLIFWMSLGTADADCDVAANKSSFKCWGGYLILPLSGLIIGYFTNWLGITMIFRPIEPHYFWRSRSEPDGYYINFQGVFLKRQQQVSAKLADTICSELVTAKMMLEYIIKKPDVKDKVLDIYKQHLQGTIDRAIGNVTGASLLIRAFKHESTMDSIKEQVMELTLDELPEHSERVAQYMDKAFDLREDLGERLAALPPARFEGMLHPVFQEDEWMVLCLGGVLGVLVGTVQAFLLKS